MEGIERMKGSRREGRRGDGRSTFRQTAQTTATSKVLKRDILQVGATDVLLDLLEDLETADWGG